MSVRFAPSPTGRFHLGNLRTAWVSWRLAAVLGKPWVLRFEDIDTPRVVPGAMESQLADMAALGMKPFETRIQSAAHARHLALFERFQEKGWVYACTCSRKETQEALARLASAPHEAPPVYDGRCRELPWPRPHAHPTLAWRILSEDPTQDFIVARTAPSVPAGSPESFVPAYNWACAIDDFDGSHSLLVRAWDLEPVTRQQRAIHARVSELEGARPYPGVFHAALVTGEKGERLEKRTRGITLPELLERGISPEEIIRRLELSFDVRSVASEFRPELVWGEARRKLSLGELGF